MKLRPFFSVLLSFLFGMIIISSCDDIIEPSINGATVNLEAPANLYISTSYTINFWWDPIDHALTYHLQVVTPTFKSPGSLVLDTIISANKISVNLNPGQYQWRVMAENGSSQTVYAGPRSFTVALSSINQQSVQLIYPANNFLTNNNNIIFQWGSLYGASEYQVEIDTNNFANESTIVLNQTIPGQELSFNFPKSQIYEWRVRAQNDSVQAQWSQINLVTFDNIPPPIVTLVSPANNLTLSQPIELQWNSSVSAVNYRLYVLKSDSATTYSSTFPLLLNTTSYNFNQGNSGDRVYWKVTAIDAAGNESQPSQLRSFVLQ